MLLEAARERGVDVEKIDAKKQVFDMDSIPDRKFDALDIIFDRCLSHYQTAYILPCLEKQGHLCVNSSEVARICGDKVLTSLELTKAGIRTPRTMIAFTPETALEAVDEIGYPSVMKPVVGSWGRLLAKVENREAAEAIIEHKSLLGNRMHSIFYIQEHIDKPGRDIRSFVVGDEVVAAIYRESTHWITNTASGGIASNCPLTDELKELSLKASEAVGVGILACDFMETPQGLTCHEVNYTVEFRNSVGPTGVDIPGKMFDYLIKEARA